MTAKFSPPSRSIRNNRNTGSFSEKHAVEKDYIREKLPESDRERFDEMENISQEIGDLYSYEDFSCGFRLGLLIALEVTQEPEALSKE